MMHFEKYDAAAPRSLSAYDHWIRARMGAAIARVRGGLDNYRFNEAAGEIYSFTWDELCDWYLELSKGTLYDEDDSPEGLARRQGARHTLLEVFHALVRLVHPIMPFLSDEMWRRLPGTEGTVMLAAFPKEGDFPTDTATLGEVAYLQEAIVAIRRIRADMELSPKLKLPLQGEDVALLQKYAQAFLDLAGVGEVLHGKREGACATAVVRGQELYLSLEGVIDLDAERVRLDKQIQKTEKDVHGLSRRLNPGFKAKAPAHVVAEFEAKLQVARDRLGTLQAARERLS
jgi:valyl-tRNA synthetase